MKLLLTSLVLLGTSPLALAQESEGALFSSPSGEPLPEDAYDPGEEIMLVPNLLETVRVIGLQQNGARDYASSAITVLEADTLQVRDTGFVADQLRGVPGLAVSRSGASGGLTQVRLRGAEANHTLVLLNGIDISDPLTGETDFGLVSGLSPRKIEVARGEQSTFWGSSAIGGVITIETERALDPDASVSFGSFDTRRADGQFGIGGESPEGRYLSFSASGFETDGVDTSGLGGEADGSRSASLLAVGRYGFENDVSLEGLVRWADSTVQTDPDDDFDGRLENADRETESEQLTLGLVLEANAFELDHRLSLDWNEVERENLADGSGLTTARGTRTRIAASSQATYMQVPGGDLSIGALVDHRIEDYSARDTTFGGFTNQDRTFRSTGLAAQADYYSYDWVFSASLRQDFNDGRFQDATTWRLGLSRDVYTAGSWDTRLRASVGSGVKNPTFTELFGFFPGSFVGNPDLDPERSTSAEIGADLQGFVFDVFTEASLTVFHAKLDHEIETRFLPGFISTVENSENTSRRTGVEASVFVELTDTVSFNSSLSWIDSRVSGDSAEIRVPEWTGSLGLTWRPGTTDGPYLGVALDYVGATPDIDFGTFRTVSLGDYPLLSASAEWPLSERVSLTLRGENLLDREARDVFGFAQAGAAGFVGLKLR